VSVFADVLSWIFLLAGAVFTLIGGIGVLRMPDVFTRLHASGVSDMLGAGFVLVGLMFQAGFGLALIKVVLLLGFFAITSPTAAHVLAKCALHTGLRPLLGDGVGSGSKTLAGSNQSGGRQADGSQAEGRQADGSQADGSQEEEPSTR
jgi:multicomponent Na+:H+ antiporter subunit G